MAALASRRKALFYWQGDAIMSVEVPETDGGLTIGKTERLFQAKRALGGLGAMYDVSADGAKFVVGARTELQAAKPLMLVVNWPALLHRH